MNDQQLLKAAQFLPDYLNVISAWTGHLPFAAWVINEVKPKLFVELGSHYGASYFSFCQSVLENKLETQCYAVDTWQGDDHTNQYGEDVYAQVNKHNKAKYIDCSHLLRMTFDAGLEEFEDGSIELLHIDGFHTYEAVSHDFNTWLPKLAPGAIVLFHDTNVYERDFGVWKFWEELQQTYSNTLEFKHCFGLGVLQLPDASADKLSLWAEWNDTKKATIINYFASLGERQQNRHAMGQYKAQAYNLEQALKQAS